MTRLKPCPSSPNCVCSRDSRPAHRVEPLAFDGDAATAWRALRDCIASLPRTQVIVEQDGYLHAQCRIAVFGFTDDLECELDQEAKLIQVRSGSRLGRYDFGVNRRRVQSLRRAFAAAMGLQSQG